MGCITRDASATVTQCFTSTSAFAATARAVENFAALLPSAVSSQTPTGAGYWAGATRRNEDNGLTIQDEAKNEVELEFET